MRDTWKGDRGTSKPPKAKLPNITPPSQANLHSNKGASSSLASNGSIRPCLRAKRHATKSKNQMLQGGRPRAR
eukprot:CAMPEP_0203946568 /NCGR_PEP_ID=MMETSP0359-20131031/81786_1 /ASSEMBLY_ACC=CAM_ASM_000338 /TAXON_ID=268821 /ORGANISM="Scrippsiella Hangoei, Strain SHTV-5" /LENGTH=72 /DNA_ID=CAMNT_0050877883 /DNA_START=489 /DNA_END=703 /DNA_ORIENTATION=-